MKISDEERRNIERRYNAMKPYLSNERLKRIFAASEAKIIGHGGRKILSEITGLTDATISRGIYEIDNPETVDHTSIRAKGGGRKTIEEVQPGTEAALKKLLDESTCGSPESPLKWTKLSLHNVANALNDMGYSVSYKTVHALASKMGYSMQGNQKAIEGGSQHPDRDAQFEHISKTTKEFQEKEQPVISVDTKKKENVGNYKNGGKEWRPKGNPIEVNVHDFQDKELGAVRPYGVYDISKNEAWVNVGTDKDTAEFAVESIRKWWYKMGSICYPDAKQLLITADGGGSNSSRSRLWKHEIQKLANELQIEISVCHYPPGTSKWNKIEHRLFSYISHNWRGRPLVSHEVIVNLISSTKTKTGLIVNCELDENKYEKGIKISDKEMAAINIKRNEFHGEDWNYTIKPQNTTG